MYQPQNNNAAVTLSGEYEFAEYSNGNIGGTSLLDVSSYRIGFEYWVNDVIPLRAGLVFNTSPFRRDLGESVITLGTGFKWGNISLDLAGNYSSLAYSYFDIFKPENDPSNPSGIEKISESRSSIFASLTYQFQQ